MRFECWEMLFFLRLSGEDYDPFTRDGHTLLKSEEEVEVWMEANFVGVHDTVLLFKKPAKFIGSGKVEYGLKLLSRVDRYAVPEIQDTILDPIPFGNKYKGRLIWSLGETNDHYLREASVMLSDGHVNQASWIEVELNSEQYKRMAEKGLLCFYSERVGLNRELRREEV